MNLGLSSVNNQFKSLSFGAEKKLLIAGENSIDRLHRTQLTLSALKSGDTLKQTDVNNLESAKKCLKNCKYDIVITGGHLNDNFKNNRYSGESSGLELAKIASKKISPDKIVMISEDSSLKNPAKKLGITFIQNKENALSILKTVAAKALYEKN